MSDFSIFRARRGFSSGVAIVLTLLLGARLEAQRNLRDIPEPDIDTELSSFVLDEGLEISLFAADPLVSKPIHMNFDSAGRLWVVSSPLYPHLAPGDAPRDRVIVLEDTDGDGRADRSRVFADELLMPTGIEVGDGGVFVANSTELLWLEDTDGDLRADRRRVVLSGFGTEDTHHLIHTFRWGPDGSLYFEQSIYIHSHVETPWGVRRMDGGGIWRFRVDSLRLEPFLWGMCNPWGHHFDEWGQSLGTDGAGFEGVHYLFPGVTCRHSPRPDPILPGLNPGSPKYCGLEIVHSSHFPEEWQGHLITADFRAQGVCRFELRDDGAGFAAIKMPDVVRSKHVAFRPVDIKVGPDGALYVADWYNPIIQHGEVGFRDPRRNRENGRIWRIAYKGRKALENPRLDRKDVPQLLDELRSSEGWNRHFAKRELAARDRNAVSTALGSWIGALAPSDPRHEHHLLEALWLRETLDEVDESLLRRLLEAEEPRARAAAVRVVAHWREQLPSALELLARAVVDPFPRVRLEAVRALSEIADPRAAVVAAAALDQPMDSFLDYALGLTFRDLASVWVPALREGALDFGAPAKLDFALRAVGSQQVTGSIAKLIREDDLSPERRHALLVTLARAGGPEELDLVLDEALGARSGEDPSGTAALIAALEASGRSRGVFPAQKPAGLEKLFSAADEPVATGALRLAGAWRAATLRGPVAAIAVDRERAVDVRLAAIEALSEIGESGSRETLRELANESSDRSIRIHATASIARIDLELAARSSIDLLAKEKGLDVSDVEVVLGSFLGRKDGAARLESALEGATLPPDVAKLALRVVRDSGLDLEDLVAALRTAGRLPDAPEPTSAEERARILEAFSDAGDPARGELVFRRDDLRCMQCHAIGGAGGRVGPDLSTIGASAQPDYILDSILDPPVAIKEGFHAAAVITQAGEVLTGVRVRRGDDGIVLRLSDDREVFVARSAIATEEEAGSIMPAGLDHDMTRQELLDLLAFLTRLGKPGAYAVRSELTLRSWALLSKVPSSIAALSEKERIEAIRELSSSEWTRTSSMVSGDVPIPHADAPVWAQSSLDVSTPGRVDLEVDCGRAIRVWVDGRPFAPTSKEHEGVLSVSLERGRRTLLFEVAPGRESRLRVTIHTPPDGGAGVRPALHSSP